MLDRSGPCSTALLVLATFALAGALELGCSSDDSASSSPAPGPYDSGQVVVPEAGPAPVSEVTVQTQGQGTVYSDGANLLDSGKTGAVTCAPGGPASECTASIEMTLYAVPSAQWVFAGWTTTGLDAGKMLSESPSAAYTITDATPSPLIAVFVPLSGSGSDDAGAAAAPVDAGHD
jgi:hypothetical protein